ncbi:phenylalanine 4-monooxygenase [Streptomyces sp. NPDC101150]|uniref:phenylalanine 4-monooxygenase n=1 Tax=Streptomyces sp. NPDC101150 TaxID=3366114 RepID=UPI003815D8CC
MADINANIPDSPKRLYVPKIPINSEGRLGPVSRHPGFRDRSYLARRNAVAALAGGHAPGDASPPVTYTEEEHRTWRTVHAALGPAHREHACRAVLEAREDAAIPADRVPQHWEVGAHLRTRTGFDFTPAGGFVPNRRFLGTMERSFFHAVQFVRHPAVPLYTPEPDVIHDVFGHGVHLASEEFAVLYRLIGRAAGQARTEAALDLLSRVYWFTLEVGVMAEGGAVKAYGAALLSSYAEITQLARNEIRELDIRDMMRTPYDVTGYQPVLFSARSMRHLTDVLGPFCEEFDDETGARLGVTAGPPGPGRRS